MTDKFRKQEASLPSLLELLGDRDGEAGAELSDESHATPQPRRIEPAPKQEPPPPADRGHPTSPQAPESPEAPFLEAAVGHREAFEPNWYRVLAAQAEVRSADGGAEDPDAAPGA